MGTSSTACFNRFYGLVKATIPNNPEWANHTGYKDNITKHPVKGKPGDCFKGIDDSERRFIVVKTTAGDIIIFERHPNKGPIVYNCNQHIKIIFDLPSGGLSEDKLYMLLGESEVLAWNAEHHLQKVFEAVQSCTTTSSKFTLPFFGKKK